VARAQGGGWQGLAAFCMFFEQNRISAFFTKKNLHPAKPCKPTL
jgi:hypothetical protein